MKNKTGYPKKIRTVLIITLCWTLFACISFISQYFFIYDLIALKRLSGSFPFRDEFIAAIIFGVLGGLLAGYVLVFKMSSRYRRRSFLFGMINSGVLFILTYLGLAVIGLFIMDLVYFSFNMSFSSALLKSRDNVLFNILSPSFFYKCFSIWFFGFMYAVHAPGE